MSWTREERDLIDEKFKGVSDKLDYIKEQVDRTNNRVTELEAKDVEHLLRCPQKEKIEKIEEELIEYRVIKKYPKFFIVSVVIVGLGMILMTLHQMGFIGG